MNISIDNVLEAIEEYLNKPKGTLCCYTKTVSTRFPAIVECTVNFFNDTELICTLKETPYKENMEACYTKMFKQGIVKILEYFNNETSKD